MQSKVRGTFVMACKFTLTREKGNVRNPLDDLEYEVNTFTWAVVRQQHHDPPRESVVVFVGVRGVCVNKQQQRRRM